MICTLSFETFFHLPYILSLLSLSGSWVRFELYFCRFDYEVSYTQRIAVSHRDLLWYAFLVGRRAGEQFQCITNVCGNLWPIKCTHWAGKEALTRQSFNQRFSENIFTVFIVSYRPSGYQQLKRSMKRSWNPWIHICLQITKGDVKKLLKKVSVIQLYHQKLHFCWLIDSVKKFRWESFWPFAGNMEHTGSYFGRGCIPSCSPVKEHVAVVKPGIC